MRARLTFMAAIPAEMRSSLIHYGDVFEARNSEGALLGIWAETRFHGAGFMERYNQLLRRGVVGARAMVDDRWQFQAEPPKTRFRLRFRGEYAWMDGFPIHPADTYYLEGLAEGDQWVSLLFDDLQARPALYWLLKLFVTGISGTWMDRVWNAAPGTNASTPPIDIMNPALRTPIINLAGIPRIGIPSVLALRDFMVDGKPTRPIRTAPIWVRGTPASALGAFAFHDLVVDYDHDADKPYEFTPTRIITPAENALAIQAHAVLARVESERESERKRIEDEAANLLVKAEQVRKQKIVDTRNTAISAIQEAQDEAAEALEMEAARLSREAVLVSLTHEDSWTASLERNKALEDLAQLDAFSARTREIEAKEAVEKARLVAVWKENAEKEIRERAARLLREEAASQAEFEAERERIRVAAEERKKTTMREFREKTGKE